MTARANLLESIAATISDYREGEIPKPTPDHVDRWASQFPEDIQEPLLKEMDHVLDSTYFDKKWVVDFFIRQVRNEKLAGTNSCDFWRNANFLDIQQNGHSQKEMLEVLDDCLQAQCNLKLEDCGSSSGPYIYLDDALFTGFHVGDDLERWLDQEAPEKGKVYILIIASHKLGEWQTLDRLKKQAKESDKDIKFDCWRAISYENRKKYCDNSEVLWPAVLPNDESLQTYMAEEQKYPFKPRQTGGTCEHEIFSCEEGRQLLETQLLLAGLKIRSFSENPSPSLRPLGFSPFGLGFGATVVTFRNCPNNCPLALWWGDPEAGESHPFSKWYPLLPRKTYGEENGFGEIYFE